MEVQIKQETCSREGCGVSFWMEANFKDRLVSTKRTFYCPNGHAMHYLGETDEQKIARLKQEHAQELREKDLEIGRIKKECRKKRKNKKRK